MAAVAYSAEQRQRGMTLLELTVAMAIFALLAAGLYGTFTRTVSTRRYVGQRSEAYSRARTLIDIIERDLRASFMTQDYNRDLKRFFYPGPDRFELSSDSATVLDFTCLSARGVPSPEAPIEASWAGPARGDQVRVVYRIQDRTQLWRYEIRPPLREEVDFEETPGVLLDDSVTELSLRFYNRKRWLEQWDSVGPGADKDIAPALVETTVAVTAEEGPAVELTSAVLLPLAAETGTR